MLYVHLYYVIKWFYQLKVTQTWLNDTKQPISGKDISIFHPDIHPLSNGPVILHTAKVVGEGILNFDVAISVSLCPGEGFLTVTNWHLAWTGLAYSIAPGVRSDPLKWRAVDSQEISTCLLLYETYFETGNDAHKCVSIETSALQINSKMWHPCGTPIPSASGFAVGFGYLNTEPNRVFGALGIVAFRSKQCFLIPIFRDGLGLRHEIHGPRVLHGQWLLPQVDLEGKKTSKGMLKQPKKSIVVTKMVGFSCSFSRPHWRQTRCDMGSQRVFGSIDFCGFSFIEKLEIWLRFIYLKHV